MILWLLQQKYLFVGGLPQRTIIHFPIMNQKEGNERGYLVKCKITIKGDIAVLYQS